MRLKKMKHQWMALLMAITLLVTSMPGYSKAQEAEEPTVYQGTGFEVAFRITSQWEAGANAELTLTNTGEAVLENWALSFPFPYAIEQVWNGELTAHDGDWYTIRNAGWNRGIKSGESVTFGFTIKAEGQILPPEQYEMPSRKEEAPESQYTVTYQVTNDWGTGFEGTITIENRSAQAIEDWELSFDLEEDLTNIWDAVVVSHEGSHYVIKNAGYNASLAAGQTLTLGFTGKENQGGEPAQVVLKESRTDLPADTNRDTDQDGLPDVIELEVGTNPFAFDTDGDGLDDGYEYYQLGTDPTKADTDGNGTLDGEEDFDADGLTNAEEYELGTSPHSADSDLDGLEDKAERDRYQTEPLKEDTDGDGISDGDEVALGLNPLSPATHGIPDNEYTVEQKVSEEVLEDINTDNAYKLSVELTAAGVADHSLNIEESDHSDLLSDNDAIVGKVVDLEYEGLKVEQASLSFTIEESTIGTEARNYQDPGLEGIKRFQVFHYEEENGILYPVETIFHEETKTLEVETQTLGTYCLLDVDQWLYDLGMPEEEEEGEPAAAFSAEGITREGEEGAGQEAEAVSGSAIEAEVKEDSLPENYVEEKLQEIQERYGNTPSPFALSKEKEYHKQIDLVFLLDTSGSMGGKIAECKKGMKTLVKNLYQAGISARVAVLSFADYNKSIIRYTLEDGKKKWAKNPKEADSLISQVSVTNGARENHVDALEAVAGLKYRGNTTRFAVMLTDEPLTKNDNHSKIGAEGIAKKLKEANIITSVVCMNYNIDSFQPIFTETEGIQISLSSNFNYILETFIETVMRESSSFTVVLPNTLSTITLEKSPRQEDTTTDSDGDTLPDSKEINWAFITEDKETIVLPTLYEYAKSYAIKPEGFARLKEEKQNYLHSLLILPIFSNPASKDSDHDGYADNKDRKPLIKSVKEYSLKSSQYILVRGPKEDKTEDYDSYGGNQSWFKESWNGRGDATDKKIKDAGCGLIAAADLFLYWAYQNPDYGDVLTGPCLREKVLTRETYMEYVRRVDKYYTNTPSGGEFGPLFARDINYYTALHDLKYASDFKLNLSADKAESLIIKMMKQNIPAILLLGSEREEHGERIEVKSYEQINMGDRRYDYEKNALHQYEAKRTNVNSHYFMVTGILYDTNTENKDERIMLRISTWGEERYVKFEEYRKYMSGLSKVFLTMV